MTQPLRGRHTSYVPRLPRSGNTQGRGRLALTGSIGPWAQGGVTTTERTDRGAPHDWRLRRGRLAIDRVALTTHPRSWSCEHRDQPGRIAHFADFARSDELSLQQTRKAVGRMRAGANRHGPPLSSHRADRRELDTIISIAPDALLDLHPLVIGAHRVRLEIRAGELAPTFELARNFTDLDWLGTKQPHFQFAGSARAATFQRTLRRQRGRVIPIQPRSIRSPAGQRGRARHDPSSLGRADRDGRQHVGVTLVRRNCHAAHLPNAPQVMI